MNTQEAIKILERLAAHTDFPNGAGFEELMSIGHAIEVMKRGEWQDISTAPRDGTLVWVGRNYNNAPVRLASWDMTRNEWKTGPSVMDCYISPTHFQYAKIPPAPTPDKEG